MNPPYYETESIVIMFWDRLPLPRCSEARSLGFKDISGMLICYSAGHYVPQLMALIHDRNEHADEKINLKGMMVSKHTLEVLIKTSLHTKVHSI